MSGPFPTSTNPTLPGLPREASTAITRGLAVLFFQIGDIFFQVQGMDGIGQRPPDCRSGGRQLFQVGADQWSQRISGRAIRTDADNQALLFREYSCRGSIMFIREPAILSTALRSLQFTRNTVPAAVLFEEASLEGRPSVPSLEGDGTLVILKVHFKYV